MLKARSKNAFRIPLRAVAYQHGPWWIAHCLELDLVAEGKNPEKAFRDLVDLIAMQIDTAIRNGDIESVFRAAPPEIWAMFSRAVDKPVKSKLPKSVERFETREAVLV